MRKATLEHEHFGGMGGMQKIYRFANNYVADDIETALLCCVAARKLEGERV